MRDLGPSIVARIGALTGIDMTGVDMADAMRACCPLWEDAGARAWLGPGRPAGRDDPASARERRVREALRQGTALVRRDLQRELGRPVPDEILLGVVGPVVDAAERALFRAEALDPHSIAELHDAYGRGIDAAQERWFARLRPLLLAVIEAALPDLEGELTPVVADFAGTHRGLLRP
jgi:hypothetical protein